MTYLKIYNRSNQLNLKANFYLFLFTNKINLITVVFVPISTEWVKSLSKG
jgi:hypothetical protein